MSRYIDADVLIDDLIHNRSFYPAIVASAIKNTPTADVVEVRHGHWEVCGAFDDFLKCSLCHSDYPWMQVSHHNYCPNCGADMRGIKNDKE